jgi:preprotein translocase subunit SecA
VNFLRKLLGDSSGREAQRLGPTVQRVNALEPEMQALSEQQLHDKTTEFRGRFLAGEDLDSLLPEAFAAVREASRRVLGQRHFDVQILAGAVLHSGKIAEMRTGEGKTLVATLPLYLNALTGKGCHLVTPNDYLSRLGGGWMGSVYHGLGLSVGVIAKSAAEDYSALYDPTYMDPAAHADDRLNHWRPVHRREAYAADITYGTNNEYGFDFLRDNMVNPPDRPVQRELHFAIVDEVDNILIDEARTPLIISGPAEESAHYYQVFARVVRPLKAEIDYTIEERTRSISLTEEGIERVERAVGIQNIYAAENYLLTHYLENALKAQFLFRNDKDYVVKDGEIIIVDEHTGRLMHGRRYSEGLHQAIEAKEGQRVQRENLTIARITFQNYFRMYSKLAGMTGTAYTERDEFHRIYNLPVVQIPTHRPMVRRDESDLVFKTEESKYRAVVRELLEMHCAGRPVLVGTASVERSEFLSGRLGFYQVQQLARVILLREALYSKEGVDKKQREQWHAQLSRPLDELTPGELQTIARGLGVDPDVLSSTNVGQLAECLEIADRDRLSEVLRSGVPHHVLNAKNHEREAWIVAQAGRPAMVTIATNMAGRGVDILLGGNPDGLVDELLRENGVTEEEATAEQVESFRREAEQRCQEGAELVRSLGGLHVLGTERHESRRIDNQLRGRAGRQGDPGSSRFYVSLEDELMRRFGGSQIASLMEKLGLEEDVPLEHSWVNKAIENAQQKVESFNFDARKHVVEYDDVMNKHREVIYSERQRVLTEEDLRTMIMTWVEEHFNELVETFLGSENPEEWDVEALLNEIRQVFPPGTEPEFEELEDATRDEVVERLVDRADEVYDRREEEMGAEAMRLLERLWILRVIDQWWIQHLTAMDDLREGIGLRAYGQRDPLVEYKAEAYRQFDELTAMIRQGVVRGIFRIQLNRPAERPKAMERATTNREEEQPKMPVQAGKKVGRNDPCPCGSGRKFKRCHGK